ncbi:hypothetical protein [Georgenia yuyongxinii]|uniref:Integral membrane protein n=1 Tax=Georgenia yuyongxinii TaxID=2589797 RepID=A0A552WVH9_9MICO|nr:hypothetical protein [Georgenia yuyongxinii]TRW46838.1 hypothetical protein FJ693_03760 [Georgenia yuyongxinii]
MQLTVTLTAILVALLGLWALWFAVVGRAVILRQLIAGGVVEVAIVAQLVVAFIGVARGYELAEPWTFWGYVVTALFLLPVAGVWALADRTRWSSVVLVVACLAILAMQARVWQVWSA